MGSLRLPVIYFSKENIESGGAFHDEVRSALEEFGCFEAVYDKVTLELHKAVFALLEDLFNLPPETKSKNTSSKPYYGYAPSTPQFPFREGLGVDNVTKFEEVQNFTNLMWPEGKPNFCEILHAYATRISELEKMVKQTVFQSYGVEKYYDSHAESIDYLLGVKKYKAPMTDEAKVGVPSHTDKSYLTILHQNQVRGLEVQTKDGEWIMATPSPSSHVVLVGEALHAWTNGRLRCPPHRVMVSGNKTRYSTALFAFSRKMVECPIELVDEEHPLLFKPFDQMGLLAFYSTEEGQKADSTLKAYCGV